MRYLAILLTCMFACGDNEQPPYTWGDATQEVGLAFCSAIQECGYSYTPEQLEVCAEHSSYHMCKFDGTCEVSLPDGAEESVAECVAAFGNIPEEQLDLNCFLLSYYGVFPSPLECSPFFDLNPSKE
jgi:hypothetical protein